MYMYSCVDHICYISDVSNMIYAHIHTYIYCRDIIYIKDMQRTGYGEPGWRETLRAEGLHA